jgi:ectoine hydroxylase-related dioxygenase (phytanoyl-CoA dioxygenase family)
MAVSMTAALESLHRRHGPITKLFAPPQQRDEFKLTDAQVRFYRENGYVKGGRVLSDEQIAVLREGLERIRRNENPRVGRLYEIDAEYTKAPDKHVFHFLGAWLVDEAFHDILWHPAITTKAAQLLETPRVRFWHDQVFYKPPRHPGVVAWHQDYSYWTRAAPPRHATCNILLDDATLENGCLHFVPGSHRWGLLPKLQLLKDMEAIKEILTPEQRAQFKPEPMILKAGECTFHHSHTMHGSYGNKSDGPRRAIVLNFMHPETRSADGAKPLLMFVGGGGVPIIPEGEIIQGDYFPILTG